VHYDHIIDLNNKIADMREQSGKTLAMLRRQHEQVEGLVASATKSLQAIATQIEQVESLQEVMDQIAATESPLRIVEIERSVAAALRESHQEEEVSGNAA
jgi:DNA-binding FrmR family transcriptional regulator